jgi:ribosomal protein S3
MFKKILIKIVENRLKDRQIGKNITSSIWWYLGKKLQDKDVFNDIISDISKYWANRSSRPYITDLIVIGETIFVYVRQPGLMIGRCGMDIDNLLNDINYNTNGEKKNNYKFSIIEDKDSAQQKIDDYRLFFNKIY